MQNPDYMQITNTLFVTFEMSPKLWLIYFVPVNISQMYKGIYLWAYCNNFFSQTKDHCPSSPAPWSLKWLNVVLYICGVNIFIYSPVVRTMLVFEAGFIIKLKNVL